MKLYNMDNNRFIKVVDTNIRIPPAAPQIHNNEVLKFYHIDGMYSFCKNLQGETVHLAAFAEVVEVRKCKKDGWVEPIIKMGGHICPECRIILYSEDYKEKNKDAITSSTKQDIDKSKE